MYSGIYLNEIMRVNITQPSSFTADFYYWMRYAKPEAATADASLEKDAAPENIVFPDLVQGSPEEIKLFGQSEQPDGTRYRLWHLRGEFKNDFDFHHFPLDRQILTLRFPNAHADSSRIVYVKDPSESGGVEPEPFRNLTQWEEPRQPATLCLRTRSSLGNVQEAGRSGGASCQATTSRWNCAAAWSAR